MEPVPVEQAKTPPAPAVQLGAPRVTLTDMLRPHIRRAIAYAVFLGLALGITVAVGSHLANSMPSEERPFGWDGPANFQNGVAMVRTELVLAATLPALLMGLHLARNLEPQRDTPGRTAAILLAHLGLLLGASVVGAFLALTLVQRATGNVFLAFVGTHFLLAAAFFGIALLCGLAAPRHGGIPAGIAWVLFVVLYDPIIRWRTLRSIGLPGIQAGALPSWFYAAQVLSPVALYRALLIIWEPQFMDYEEKAVLEGATLPAWMQPHLLFAAYGIVWVILPLFAAWTVWTLKRRQAVQVPVAATPLVAPNAPQGPVRL